jgi:hypothetical protein
VADGDHEARPDEDHHLADLDELVAVDVARGLEYDDERVASVDLELLGALVGGTASSTASGCSSN